MPSSTVGFIGVADRGGGREREAADEDGQAVEERLLVRVEQVVAPGDGVAHRLQAGRLIARPAGQQRQRAGPGRSSRSSKRAGREVA